MEHFELRLASALENYQVTLNGILSSQCPSATQVLVLFKSRDRLQLLLDKSQYSLKVNHYETILELDQQLTVLITEASNTIETSLWVRSFNPPKSHWWWYLEKPLESARHFDWLWKGLTIAFLSFSLTFLVKLAAVFLSEGPDILGAFTIISQSTLTLLAAGGTLSKTGERGLEKFFSSQNIAKKYWGIIKLFLAITLLIMTVSVYSNLNRFSNIYLSRGKQHQENKFWSNAEKDFQRSLMLNPDNAETHFRLGLLYEEILDLEKAQMQYELATQGGNTSAKNNLAYLYIQQQRYADAFFVLNSIRNFAFSDSLGNLSFADTRAQKLAYSIRKNLGWARLGQMRFSEAAVQLNEAIRISPETGDAYCLLAQVHEQQQQLSAAINAWQNCIAFTDSDRPERDLWLEQGRQYLENNSN